MVGEMPLQRPVWPAHRQSEACEVWYPPGPGTVTDWTSKHRSLSGPQLHSSGGGRGQEDRLWCDQKPQSCNGRERPLAWSLRTQPRGQPATAAPGGLLLEPGLVLSVRGTVRLSAPPPPQEEQPSTPQGAGSRVRAGPCLVRGRCQTQTNNYTCSCWGL